MKDKTYMAVCTNDARGTKNINLRAGNTREVPHPGVALSSGLAEEDSASAGVISHCEAKYLQMGRNLRQA